MNETMKQAWLEISQMLGEPTREELDVFLRTWQRATEAHKQVKPDFWEGYVPEPVKPSQKRPQNCGTSYCSCIECVMEPAQQEPEYIVQSNGSVSPLLTHMMNKRVKSNVKQVIELYDSPEQPAQQEPVNQRAHEIALRQWESWKTYALELQEKLVKYEGGTPMVLNTSPPAQRKPLTDEEN